MRVFLRIADGGARAVAHAPARVAALAFACVLYRQRFPSFASAFAFARSTAGNLEGASVGVRLSVRIAYRIVGFLARRRLTTLTVVRERQASAFPPRFAFRDFEGASVGMRGFFGIAD